jgi:signal transduction histidine kinase
MLLSRHMWTVPVVRPWTRLLAAWGALTMIVAAGLCTRELRELGWNDGDGAVRIASAITRDFADAGRSLDQTSQRVGRDPALLARAASDTVAARTLFDLLHATGPEQDGISVTVYSAAVFPIAWSGRPSDVPRARAAGGAAMFVAPGPLGPRLVSVQPVTGVDPTRAGFSAAAPRVRLATIVTERLLPSDPPDEGRPGETVVWTIAGVTVPLRARYQGAGGYTSSPGWFTLNAPDGSPLLEGQVRPAQVARARQARHRELFAVLLLIAAVCCTLAAAPLLAWRVTSRAPLAFTWATVLAMSAVCLGRVLAWFALPWLSSDLPSNAPLVPALRSVTDFLLTSAAALLLVLILGSSILHARRGLRRFRRDPADRPSHLAALVASSLLAGSMMVALFLGMSDAIRAIAGASSADVLSLSFHPDDPQRLALEAGLVISAAASLWLAVMTLLSALVPFRMGHISRARLVAIGSWAVPPLVWFVVTSLMPGAPDPRVIAGPTLLAIALAASWRLLLRAYRHTSQAARLIVLFAALVTPALSWYPALYVESDRAKRTFVATDLAPQSLRQRDDLQLRVREALKDIDGVDGLVDLIAAKSASPTLAVPTEAAFHVWSQTALSRLRLTSAIELYGADGLLVSRFALKLPDYASAQQVWEGSGCGWQLYEEVSPFFSEERRLLYAGRGLCVDSPGGRRVVGAIALYAMLDYGDLPFMTAQSPYAALVRGRAPSDPATAKSRNVTFVTYGWSRKPVYASGTPWTLDDETFRRVYASRTPFWTTLSAGGRRYEVHLANDRAGIYALGYPALSPVEHLVNATELVVLGGVTFVIAALVMWLTVIAGGYRGFRGRDLLREVRASFYRKLFLAFVAAAAIPVIILAGVVRSYMTARLLAGIEDAAAQTASVAQRVVEDYAQLQERDDRRITTIDDDILVWIARVIDQDVNVFDGPSLVATSERNLYASGVLPTRTSADIYRAITLDRRAAFVADERVGAFGYLTASTPVKLSGREAILTVPLALRQQAIAFEIDDLNRRIQLAVLAFILMGSALGYWMAERIADPVRRLQRATARIARGDLSVRVAVTSSDELRRLVEAFNQMAGELQRQQRELERTHKLEAWADMARQVAHEIKNPLTPIQLSAEHLRRVHADRGAPLSPLLEGCVDSILTQVRLLRQIAGEFSSFASAPANRPVQTSVAELLREVVDPYTPGLAGRITLHTDAPVDLPAAWIDRTLIGRALTNIVDNAIHAMPRGGTITITARLDADVIAVHIVDTGVGMGPAAIARIFEPYFSTKATGTGLGLTIAKRNVELSGGQITVRSAEGKGTAVTITLPINTEQ